MSGQPAGWRSKCPYNIADPKDSDPCPRCDVDNPQCVTTANDGAEVGRVMGEQPASPSKPPLCWICGKPLPHDCMAEQYCKALTPATHGPPLGTAQPGIDAFYEYCTIRDIDMCNNALQHAFETGWGVGRQSHKAQVFGMLRGYQAKFGSPQNLKLAWQSYKESTGNVDQNAFSAFQAAWRACSEQSVGNKRHVTHGPPRKPSTSACSLCPHRADLRAQIANSFAPSATATNPNATRKWPIGTPSDDHYNLAWGYRLQQARAHRGLTLDALGARLTPVRTRKDISAMGHGRRGLSVELCAELAQALDCDRCWLAGWKE